MSGGGGGGEKGKGEGIFVVNCRLKVQICHYILSLKTSNVIGHMQSLTIVVTSTYTYKCRWGTNFINYITTAYNHIA